MPIGDYWMYCMSKNNNISLYGESTENFEDTDNTEIENNIENTINKFLPPLTDGTYPTLEESFAKTVNNASNVNFGRISSKESDIDVPFASKDSLPSREGAFLSALVIYKTLVDKTLNDIEYTPNGMSRKTKDALIAIASAKAKK